MRTLRIVAGTLLLLTACGASLQQPDARVSEKERKREMAIERGLSFIAKIASNPKYFSRWGSDLLWCFYTISTTAKNEGLRAIARDLGLKHAREWRRTHPHPKFGDVIEFTNFVYGAEAADMLLGERDERLRQEIRVAAKKFSTFDYLEFDPRVEPPPRNLPDYCPKCDYENPRGFTRCKRCHARLKFRNRYDIWEDALVMTYSGDLYGVELGAPHADVVRWASVMRPYPKAARLRTHEREFNAVTYAVTHLIYTSNDYGTYRLSRESLPHEFAFLRANIIVAENFGDGESLGEFMDTLRAFGEDDSAPEMRKAADYLLARQNPDGSWGDIRNDIYTRYHSTWTAIDGLREFDYKGERRGLHSPARAQH